MATCLILSIDGGGTRGIIPATLLHALYQDCAVHPTQLFDLFAGTSTGGILNIGITYGLDTATLVDLYQKQAKEIFYDSGWDDLRDGFGKNIGADYSTKRFKNILRKLFGEATLSDVHTKLGGNKHLMVCSFDINPTDDGKAVNFRPRVFNSGFLRDAGERLMDLALRTSAGPTYFPIYEKKYIDGGVAMNHPAMAAVAFALNQQESAARDYLAPDGRWKGLRCKPDDIKVLSLGCGTSNRNFIPEKEIKTGDWGNLQWVKYLPDLLTESNVQASEYYVQQVLPAENYMRIQLDFSSPQAPAVLHDQIKRGKSIGLDVKDDKLLEGMHTFASEEYARKRAAIRQFLGLS